MDLHVIPPLACAGIGVITFIVISLYFILLAMLRDPEGMRRLTSQKRMAQRGDSVEKMRKVTESIRTPFAEENRQLDELSRLVHDLSDSSAANPSTDTEQNSLKK